MVWCPSASFDLLALSSGGSNNDDARSGYACVPVPNGTRARVCPPLITHRHEASAANSLPFDAMDRFSLFFQLIKRKLSPIVGWWWSVSMSSNARGSLALRFCPRIKRQFNTIKFSMNCWFNFHFFLVQIPAFCSRIVGQNWPGSIEWSASGHFGLGLSRSFAFHKLDQPFALLLSTVRDPRMEIWIKLIVFSFFFGSNASNVWCNGAIS